MYSSLFVSFLALALAQTPSLEEADNLYLQRKDFSKLEKAVHLWEETLREDPKSYPSAWKLARAYYYYGTHVQKREKKIRFLEKAVGFGEKAVSLRPEQPDGHFWLGIAYGGYAQEKGMLKSLVLLKPIREELETVLKIDPDYERGGAHRILGRYFHKVPKWLGGSHRKSLEHLEKALKRDPGDTLTRLFLGDTLSALGRTEEARRHYQAVVDQPIHTEWEAEDEENKNEARKALEKLKP